MSHYSDARRPRRRVLLVLLAVAALALGLLTPAQAATGTGKISGVVKTSTGVALPYLGVALYQLNDGYWDRVTDTQTASDDDGGTPPTGTYTFTDLAPGKYRVGVDQTSTYDEESGVTSEWAADFYPGNKPFVETGSDVTVANGATKTIDFALVKGGQIQGHVTNVTEEEGSQINVLARRKNPATGDYERTSTGFLGENGTYTITGLLPGDYRLEFRDDSGKFLTEYYDDKATISEAKDVTITAPGDVVTGQDASLAVAGRIEGKVTSPANVGLQDVYVSVATFDEATNRWDDVASDNTDENGDYSIGGLATGSGYRVAFYGQDSGYLDQYYDGKDEEHADPVSVVAGQTTPNIDATLTKPGKITGKVTLPDGKAAASTSVTAYQPNGRGGWDYVDSAETSTTGTYTMNEVRPGSYKLQYQPSSLAYAAEVYNNKTSLTAGDPVVVTSGATKTLSTVQLAKAGVIAGTVTLPAGVTDASARSVAAVDKATGEVLSYGQANKTSTGKYAYSIKGLSAGSYRVDFARGSGQSLAVGQYYKGVTEKLGPATATAVKVTAGATTSKIDATVKTGGGSISGTLLNSSGAPIKCYMMALTDDGSGSTRVAYSSATTGAFTITGLSTGAYKLIAVSGYGSDDRCFFGSGDDRDYQNYYYDDSSSSVGHMSPVQSAGDTIAVTEGATTKLPSDLYYGPVTGSTFTDVPSPVVTGTGKVGSTLASTSAAPTPAADSATMQWYRGTSAISGATNASYKLTNADAGTTVSVRYTYAKSGYVNRGAGSNGVKVAGLNLTKPTITGTAKVGKTLTATKGTWAGTGWTYAYQWYRGTTKISTKSTYKAVTADKGKTLTVKVTISKSGYTGASATSAGKKIS